jgi:hypothetical protein
VQDDPFSALGEKTLALVRSRLFARGNATAKPRTLDCEHEHVVDAHTHSSRH